MATLATLTDHLAQIRTALIGGQLETDSLCQETIELAQAENNQPVLAQAWMYRGILWFYRNEYDTSIRFLETAIGYAQAIQDDSLQLQIRNIMATSYRQLGDFATATRYYEANRAHALTIHDEVNFTRALNGLASIQSNLGYPESAVVYLLEALEISRKREEVLNVAVLMGNLCHEYNRLEQYQTALEYGLQATQTLEQLQRPLESNFALTALAMTYNGLGQLERAHEALHHALEVAKTANNIVGQLDVLAHLCRIALENKQDAQAIQYGEAALALKDTPHNAIYTLYRILAEAHAAQGDYATAHGYWVQYVELLDKIRHEEALQTVKNLEIRHRVAHSQQEAAYHAQRAQEAEQLRQQDQARFEQVSQLRDNLLQNTSHDLKNPLARIVLNADLLKRHGRVDDDKGRGHLQNIVKATEQMNNLIHDLLDYFQVYSQRTPNLQTHSVAEFLQATVSTFGVQAQHHTLYLDVTPDLTASFDALLLQRAVDNLLSNAIKYTPHGGTITLQAYAQADVWCLSVADSGSGIPADELPHIFEHFYRAKSHKATTIEGTGLGLSIVQEIVQAHHGTITVTSEVGKGACFTVILPI